MMRLQVARTTEQALPGEREEVADQVRPLIAVREELARRWRVAIDLVRARGRARDGSTAYDPAEVIASAGDLIVPFLHATKAIESAGLASNDAVCRARERRFEVLPAVFAWLAGERRSSDAGSRIARRAAAIVGGSILRRASEEVMRGLALDPWPRTTCPCCGSPADIVLAGHAGRTLLCSRCDATWTTAHDGCFGCGANDAPSIARIAAPSIGYALFICNACGRYVKERAGSPPVEPMLERALTEELDEVAEKRGLRL